METRSAKRTLRCRSTHLFAKVSGFSVCEHELKKLVLTLGQKLLPSPPAMRVAYLEAPHKGRICLSLGPFCSVAMPGGFPGGTPGRAMFAPVRSTMFAFSEQANLHFRLAERGFLGSFFAAWQRMNTHNRYSARAQLCARHSEKS